MKKLLCITLTALLLLCGCTPTYAIPDTCINEIGGSLVGNTIYTDYAANLRRFTTAVPEGMSLCFDPLCSHAKEDFCAEPQEKRPRCRRKRSQILRRGGPFSLRRAITLWTIQT